MRVEPSPAYQVQWDGASGPELQILVMMAASCNCVNATSIGTRNCSFYHDATRMRLRMLQIHKSPLGPSKRRPCSAELLPCLGKVLITDVYEAFHLATLLLVLPARLRVVLPP
jgi:hypothetical protein